VKGVSSAMGEFYDAVSSGCDTKMGQEKGSKKADPSLTTPELNYVRGPVRSG